MNSKKLFILEEQTNTVWGQIHKSTKRNTHLNDKDSHLNSQNASGFYMTPEFSASYIKLRKVSITI